MIDPHTDSRNDTPSTNTGSMTFNVIEFLPMWHGVEELQEPLETPVDVPNKTDYDNELASYFFFHLRHDERYHTDVQRLHLIDRIKHLHNHMGKYNAQITRKRENDGPCEKEIIDGCIVCLSALTTLGYGGYSHESLGEYYLKQSIIRDEDINHELGCISKLLEGYDHVEPLRYIPDLTTHFQRLFVKFLSLHYRDVGKSFRKSYLERLDGIQKRNPLHHLFVKHHGAISL